MCPYLIIGASLFSDLTVVSPYLIHRGTKYDAFALNLPLPNQDAATYPDMFHYRCTATRVLLQHRLPDEEARRCGCHSFRVEGR
jgi:hypothetical protein